MNWIDNIYYIENIKLLWRNNFKFVSKKMFAIVQIKKIKQKSVLTFLFE